MQVRTTAALAAIVTFGALNSAATAAIIINFNGVTGVGAQTRSQTVGPTSTTAGTASGTLSNFDTGIVNEGGFAGNFSGGSAITATASGTTTGGVGGTGAIQLALNVDQSTGNPNNVFAGISQQASGTFTTTDPNQLNFLVDVNVPAGVQFSIRAEITANNANRARSQTFTGTGQFQTYGGLLSTFNQGTAAAFLTSFQANPTQTLTFIVSDGETGVSRATLSTDPTFVVDNIRLQEVPEPTTLGVIAAAGVALLRRRRA